MNIEHIPHGWTWQKHQVTEFIMVNCLVEVFCPNQAYLIYRPLWHSNMYTAYIRSHRIDTSIFSATMNQTAPTTSYFVSVIIDFIHLLFTRFVRSLGFTLLFFLLFLYGVAVLVVAALAIFISFFFRFSWFRSLFLPSNLFQAQFFSTLSLSPSLCLSPHPFN